MRFRRSTLGSIAVCVAAVASFLAPPTALAEPDIETVTEQVDELLHEAERAQERYNLAREDLKALRAELATLQADQDAQRAEVELLRSALSSTIVDRYQGSTISTVGQVVVADDPGEFLADLSTLSAYQGLQTDAYRDYQLALAVLDARAEATAERIADVEALEEKLAQEKAEVDEKYAAAKEILDELEAEERAAILGGSLDVPTNIDASGRAAAAVRFAMAQIGDPYVYGAAGPNSWDCSGLTMAAWGAAGVGLPHSSAAQFNAGPHIAASSLQPGDLVFYYRPISHVGMYIGRGLIVHAPHPGTPVRVAGLYSMPYVGAVRPG